MKFPLTLGAALAAFAANAYTEVPGQPAGHAYLPARTTIAALGVADALFTTNGKFTAHNRQRAGAQSSIPTTTNALINIRVVLDAK